MPIVSHICASDILLCAMFTENTFFSSKHTWFKYPNMKREHTDFWIMHWRDGSRTLYFDIVLNRHTCMITSFHWNTCLSKINICIWIKTDSNTFQFNISGGRGRVLNSFICVYIDVIVISPDDIIWNNIDICSLPSLHVSPFHLRWHRFDGHIPVDLMQTP
jgi:hypothetical protein